MFHSITGTIVSGKMKQERILIKLRRAPHRHLGAHDLLDVLHERRTFATFVTERMNDYVILLAVDDEVVLSPIGCDLGRRVDHDVPVWKLPLSLARMVQPSVYDFPTGRSLNRQFYWIRFMAHNVHEDRTAVVIRVTRIKL